MDFSEAHEWRSLFHRERGLRRYGGRRLRASRCKELELDYRLFSVDELMDFSPDRSTYCSPLESSINVVEAGTEAAELLISRSIGFENIVEELEDETMTSSLSEAEAVPVSGGPKSVQSSLAVGPQSTASVDVSEVAALVGQSTDGSTARVVPQAQIQRRVVVINSTCPTHESLPTGPDQRDSASTTGKLVARQPLPSTKREGSATERTVSTGANRPSPLFLQRSVEDYTRLDIVESPLTLQLRRQALKDDQPRALIPGIARRLSADMAAAAQFGAVDKARLMEFRVHIPPYDQESVILMRVPMSLSVKEFRHQVLRQHASKIRHGPFLSATASTSSNSAGLAVTGTGTAAFELRLYDEDEEEPDYDCPSFDENLQVGCLNVSDIALCSVADGAVTPPTQLMSAAGPDDEASGVITSPVATPEAHWTRSQAQHIPLRKYSDPEVPRPARKGSEDASSVAASASLGVPMTPFTPSNPSPWSHRRARSMPQAFFEASIYSPDPFHLSGQQESSRFFGNELDVARRRSFFNEYTASIASEYPVLVSVRGSKSSQTACTLVVDRAKLYHRVPRGASGTSHSDKIDHKKASSFMPPLLKKLGRHLSLSEADHTETIFSERCVVDIRDIFPCKEEDSNPKSFSVTYQSRNGLVELLYEAQTPTECAEIVARLHFLLVLVAKR